MKREMPDALRALPGGARHSAAQADSPTLRLFALIERMAAQDRLFTLQSLVEDTGWPKPSVHRMLQQLEGAGLVQREGDSRYYSTGLRLRRLGESLMANSSLHGARHRVLRALVDDIGESCNITAFSSGEVVYLDRVETAAPLRFYLHPGSRVPAHCSASGKVFLSQMMPAQRDRLLHAAPLERCTAGTVTDVATLQLELTQVQRLGYALDREEFLPGLVCVAVPVPPAPGQSRASLCVALQGPALRLSLDRALSWLPSLLAAAAALGRIESDAMTEPAAEVPTPAAGDKPRAPSKGPQPGPARAALIASKPRSSGP